MSITVKKMGKLEVCTPFPHFLKKSLHFLHGSGGVPVPLLLAVFSRNSTAKCIKFAPCYDPSMMTRQGNGWRPRGFPIQVGQHDSCCIDLKLLKSHEISWNAGSIWKCIRFGFKLDKRFSLAPFAVGFGDHSGPCQKATWSLQRRNSLFLKKPT